MRAKGNGVEVRIKARNHQVAGSIPAAGTKHPRETDFPARSSPRGGLARPRDRVGSFGSAGATRGGIGG